MKAETDRLLSEILTLHPKEQRHIFMSLWRHSDGLNGKIPDGTELETTAMANLLRLKNVASLDVILLDVAEEKQFSPCFDGKYIYEMDKYGKEIQRLEDDFEKKYIGRRWRIAAVFAC
ncbi:hypothetical protein CRG49_009780 [Neisseria sp. N95_16]|uniref:Uncharacterized protein n=1 Tax=Neisseria brasiliensis TaxID=2666100 RepID=A0A5Q3RWX8_9NEIS|nr:MULTISPECIES: hypothetical protein [Neisseria]MRN37429.1 hypothetical protein [Neisseria brasiliensis]PJO09022.1 hypothetical protein CRG49_009780 [Neisseria sp. N95_16]PJO77033.1 hypothetical protein CWC45_12655 [Neisseria sp. N177_16]QGL24435.1 hypothetical protein GJV52_02130 [Neisseria brasiliensis]